ncbi:MAG: ISAs1 family transposase [Acidiferrobacterales bacterium]|nr:ISAs1 family transposase [Acidiferrobacterales bacterium]
MRHYCEDLDKAHGRLEQRHIAVLEVNDPNRFDFKRVRQVFRIERDREVLKDPGSASAETVFGITSVAAEKADAQTLLAWNRGHWQIESNHYIRDKTFGEDASLNRTGNGPSNRAMCNNIALVLIIKQNRFDSVPQVLRSACGCVRIR